MNKKPTMDEKNMQRGSGDALILDNVYSKKKPRTGVGGAMRVHLQTPPNWGKGGTRCPNPKGPVTINGELLGGKKKIKA